MLHANDAASAGDALTFTTTTPQAGDSLACLLAKLLTLYRTRHGLS